MEAGRVVLVSLTVLLGVMIVWWLAARAVAVATCPRQLEPGPETQDLPDDPPAVVNLLVNRGRATSDAAPATFLDLVHRRHLDLYQPGGDPAETLVSVRRADLNEGVGNLTPYEKRVLDRVGAATGAGSGSEAVSLAELARGHAQDGTAWNARLELEVRDDARARKLIQPWLSGVVLAMVVIGAGLSLFVLAPLAIFGVLLPLARPEAYDDEDYEIGGLLGAGLFAAWAVLSLAFMLVLIGLLGRQREDRLTPAGRSAARHWLGVANWLRANAAFADTPPAAVAIWDRLLPYAIAVGAAPAAADTVGLGVGGRDRLESTYTGLRREIRVRYPVRGWRRYCQPAGYRLLTALFWLIPWVIFWLVLRDEVSELPAAAAVSIFAVAAAVPAWLIYRAVRALVDKLTPVEVTGQVLAVRQVGTFGDPQAYEDMMTRVPAVARWANRRSGGPRLTPEGGIVPLYLVAVDDGRSDELRPWVLVPKLADHCRPGTVVRLTGQDWSRRALDVAVVEPARELSV